MSDPEVREILGISREGMKVLAANKLYNARLEGRAPYPWWARQRAMAAYYLDCFGRLFTKRGRAIRRELRRPLTDDEKRIWGKR